MKAVAPYCPCNSLVHRIRSSPARQSHHSRYKSRLDSQTSGASSPSLRPEGCRVTSVMAAPISSRPRWASDTPRPIRRPAAHCSQSLNTYKETIKLTGPRPTADCGSQLRWRRQSLKVYREWGNETYSSLVGCLVGVTDGLLVGLLVGSLVGLLVCFEEDLQRFVSESF